jgi:tripartite-type tricarboxylate transporter receptor subunit TctC
MKRIHITIVISLIFSLALSGKAVGGAVEYPKAGTIANFFIGGSIGAGGDMNMRTLIRYLEPVMGITIVPNNVAGSRTIYNSFREMMRQPAEGYTFAYNLVPSYVTEIYNPEINGYLTNEDFYTLCNLVTDPAIIAVRADDERFADINDFSQFVDYLKADPSRNLLISACSVSGDDDITVRKIMNTVPEIMTQLTIVNGEAVADGLTSLLGGHLDVFTGNVGDVTSLVADGKMKVIAVFHTKRSVFFPDIQTAAETGYPIYNSSSRGIVMHKDTDPAILKKIEEYITKIVNDPVFIGDMRKQGYELYYLTHDEYDKFLADECRTFEKIMYMYDWGPDKTFLK